MAFAMLAGCASYKQNIMFKTGDNFTSEPVKTSVLKAEQNYVIQKNDFLGIEIYSNNGEKLIDPNPELSQSRQGQLQEREVTQYLVDLNGLVKFPMIGELKVEGLTLRQAELILQKEYEKFFKTPFIVLKFTNKRVIILGEPGGQVVPLMNENMTLAEVLGLAKGVGITGKAHNIRVLRKDKVYMIDFSTVQGYTSGNMIVESGDVVYVEPVRRPLAEGFRDYGIILTFLVSVTTLITIFTR